MDDKHGRSVVFDGIMEQRCGGPARDHGVPSLAYLVGSISNKDKEHVCKESGGIKLGHLIITCCCHPNFSGNNY